MTIEVYHTQQTKALMNLVERYVKSRQPLVMEPQHSPVAEAIRLEIVGVVDELTAAYDMLRILAVPHAPTIIQTLEKELQ